MTYNLLNRPVKNLVDAVFPAWASAPSKAVSGLRAAVSALALFITGPALAAFTDNGDGTVTDSATGLVWDKCSWGQTGSDCSGSTASTNIIWQQALAIAVTANSSSYKGQTDWRLPNRTELESLVDLTRFDPAIDPAVFPNTPSERYWSSTPAISANIFDLTRAWSVYFLAGFSAADGNSSPTHYVRLVRGGQGFAPFDLLAMGTEPAVDLSPASLGFGDQIIETISTSQTVTLTNSGTAVLTVTNIDISGDFAESNTCGTTLAVGANCEIQVTFTPTALGTRNGLLSVVTDSVSSPDTVSLNGDGISSNLSRSTTVDIPTLSEWGMSLLVLMLAGVGFVFGQRRLK